MFLLTLTFGFISCEKSEVSSTIGEERIIGANEGWLDGAGRYLIKFENGYMYCGENIHQIVGLPNSAKFVNVGRVNNLNKVNYVPIDGWQEIIEIKEGCGYVVEWQYYGWIEYGRIFFKEFIDKGGIKGYRVQAQIPWNPLTDSN